MIGLTLVFFRPQWPNLLINRFRRAVSREAMSEVHPLPSPPVASASKSMKLVIGLAASFLAAQVALPPRHFAYPGNVRWNEAGFLCSWQVMLTEKVGDVSFRVSGLDGDGYREGEGERELVIHPEEYLTPVQAERMAYQPDLILATAHIIRDDFANHGRR